MKLVNNIKITVFVKEGEDMEQIADAIRFFLPVDFEKEKLEIKSKTCEGFEEKKIIVLSLFIEKERHSKLFLNTLAERLSPEQKNLLIRQAESRLDNDLDFFVRFDKSRLFKDQKLVITDAGKCFHIKMNIACFPRKREKALEIIQNIFK